MEIKKAEFVKSSPSLADCPIPNKPEYTFIGRSNVGKSSLINMLTNRKSLAKTSSTPGKTQHINHFIIDNEWYLVDLPGYGWAQVSKSIKEDWNKSLRNYLVKRENLINIFVLVDIRHDPQKVDLEFMYWLGENQLPFSIIFTKSDKLKKGQVEKKVNHYQEVLLKDWEEAPPYFVTSSTNKEGKEELLDYIYQLNQEF